LSIRIVAGEIDAKDATTRVSIPTAAQPRWPPFERVAETIATPRKPFPPHRHQGVEVLTYVIEGSASYEVAPGPPRPLVSGSTMLLTAQTSVPHAINPGTGHTVRWFAVVTSLSASIQATRQLQESLPRWGAVGADGSIIRHLVGPTAEIKSTVGTEALAIEFRSPGASFQKVGHDRIAVCYALAGRGKLDNEVLEAGEAGLVEDAAGVALQGGLGFRAVFVSAPRTRAS
jgi:redox-sensitive bicupin YhaK (pirin superfamily)